MWYYTRKQLPSWAPEGVRVVFVDAFFARARHHKTLAIKCRLLASVSVSYFVADVTRVIADISRPPKQSEPVVVRVPVSMVTCNCLTALFNIGIFFCLAEHVTPRDPTESRMGHISHVIGYKRCLFARWDVCCVWQQLDTSHCARNKSTQHKWMPPKLTTRHQVQTHKTRHRRGHLMHVIALIIMLHEQLLFIKITKKWPIINTSITCFSSAFVTFNGHFYCMPITVMHAW